MLEIGQTYIGPLGHRYTVLAIEADREVPMWLIVRVEGRGTIKLRLEDAPKWFDLTREASAPSA